MLEESGSLRNLRPLTLRMEYDDDDCERRLHPTGLEVKYGITNLQWERDPVECGSYRKIKLLEYGTQHLAADSHTL